MSEYIKREDAIRIVEKYFTDRLGLNPDICLDGIRSLPDADVIERKWTPVSEKLPQDERSVLVTVQNVIGQRFVWPDVRYTHDMSEYIDSIRKEYQHGAWEYLADASGDYWNILDILTVIAWMEYPEPYKEVV